MKLTKAVCLLFFAVFGYRGYAAELGKTNEPQKVDFVVKKSEIETDATEGLEKDKAETIIISADRIGKSSGDMSLSSAVVSSEDIDEKMYTSMSDLLESTPGFSRVYDYHSPFILRGSSGTKMLILRNNNPVFSSFPGGFMGQSINIYELERVEVIRGPGSVIYGSGATCGIINIIDRDVFKSKEYGFEGGASYGSNGSSRMLTGSGYVNNGSFAMRATGRYRKSDNYEYGGGEEALNSFHEDRDMSLNAGYRFNDNHKIYLRGAAHYGGPWGKAYGFNNKEQMMARNEDDALVDFSGRYEGDEVGFFDKILMSGYYSRETREYHNMKMNSTLSKINFEDVTDYKNIYYGGSVLGAVSAGANYISFGVDSYSVRLWNPVKTIDHYNYTEPQVIYEEEGAQGAGTSSAGAFFQDVISITESLSFSGGIRGDYSVISEGDNYTGDSELSESRNALSANAGFVFRAADNHSLTFNLGRAFRMPDAVDMFSEQVTCQGTISPNPDLKPEYSWNIDAGYNGKIRGCSWELSLFSNQYSDLIVKTEDPDNPDGQIMGNEDIARIMGGEFVLGYIRNDVIVKGLSVKPGMSASYCVGGSFGSTGGQWDFTRLGDPLTGIPPARIKPNIRFMYHGVEDCGYFLELEFDYSLKKTRLSEETSEASWSNEDVSAYSLFNITAGMSLCEYAGLEEIKLNIAVSNLFDSTYYSFGSHVPGKGRDVKVFTSFSY